jgi:hypothetical protein
MGGLVNSRFDSTDAIHRVIGNQPACRRNKTPALPLGRQRNIVPPRTKCLMWAIRIPSVPELDLQSKRARTGFAKAE